MAHREMTAAGAPVIRIRWNPSQMLSLPQDVLIVEDDPIILLDLEATVLKLGVKRVRAAGTVEAAMEMLAYRVPDFALLDIGLLRDNSFTVAKRLALLRIPFAFVTGYGSDKLPSELAQTPTISKPFSTEALLAALQRFGGCMVPPI